MPDRLEGTAAGAERGGAFEVGSANGEPEMVREEAGCMPRMRSRGRQGSLGANNVKRDKECRIEAKVQGMVGICERGVLPMLAMEEDDFAYIVQCAIREAKSRIRRV